MMPDVKVKTKKNTHILSDLSQIIGNSKKKKQGKKTANSSGTRLMNNLAASGVTNP